MAILISSRVGFPAALVGAPSGTANTENRGGTRAVRAWRSATPARELSPSEYVRVTRGSASRRASPRMESVGCGARRAACADVYQRNLCGDERRNFEARQSILYGVLWTERCRGELGGRLRGLVVTDGRNEFRARWQRTQCRPERRSVDWRDAGRAILPVAPDRGRRAGRATCLMRTFTADRV